MEKTGLDEERIIGQGKIRVDALGKVTGEAKYSADLEPRDILHGKVVHASIANGVVKGFDLEEALNVPGVVKIVTCFDVPDCRYPTAGHPWSVEMHHRDICDRKILNQRVRFYGDDIAAVIAENEVAAVQAARLVKVEYEIYEPIVTVAAAMKKNAVPLHPDIRKDNVIAHSHMTMGSSDFSYEKGVTSAIEKYGEENLLFFEETYHTPRISHCHIELPVSWAYVDMRGKVTIVSSTQIPHIVRRCTAQALGMDIGKVRVIKPYIGGGFGNKQDALYEPLNALLTLAVGGRPVRLEISREETIYGTRTRHAIEGRTKAVMTKDGRVLARKLEALANNGAYASHGHAICANCGNVFKGLYDDAVGTEVDCYTVYTSSPTAGAMRAYGIPQAAWFTECLADDMAYAIGMDPVEFRLVNGVKAGYKDPANGITFHSYGLDECIRRGKACIGWDEKRRAYADQSGPVRRGVGMAMFMYKSGVYPISLETASARMILNQDGSIQLCMGATEIGQGADTVFSQMAAQTTGIDYERIYIVSTQDTDTTPFDTGAYASRQSYVSGMACKACGEQLKWKILEYAAYMLNTYKTDMAKTVHGDVVSLARTVIGDVFGLGENDSITKDMLDIKNSKIVVYGGAPILFDVAVVAETAFYSMECSKHITAEVTKQCKDNTFSSGCCFVEVEVDMPLGIVTVKNVINVHDSGVILNPKTAIGQVHGGMSMSLGYGLFEEMLVDEKTGKVLNDNLLDYKIPTAMDVPDLKVEFVEIEDPTGPYGNKSLGEPPAVPVAPAIRNAILHATGVHMNTTPMTAQRLIEKFKEQGLI